MADTIIHGAFIFERHLLPYDHDERKMRDRWVLQAPKDIILEVPSIAIVNYEYPLQEDHGRVDMWSLLVGLKHTSLQQWKTRDEAIRGALPHIVAVYKNIARQYHENMINISRVASEMDGHIKELEHESLQYRSG